MKIRCICKNRNNNGVIISYTLQDETGRIFQATASEIKREIKSKHNQFVNLQIDKAGRLVDKAEEHQPVNQKMKVEFEKNFIQLLLHNRDVMSIVDNMIKELARDNFTDMFKVNLGSDIFACAGESNDANDRLIDKMIQNNTVDQFMVIIPYIFENYLYKKGVQAPYKLHIKSKDEAFEYIEYRNSLGDIKYDINNEIGYGQGNKEDPVRNKLGRNPYYFNSNNYIISLHRLGSENNPIKIYVAPDMSLICPDQSVTQQNTNINLNKQPQTVNKQVSLGKKSDNNVITGLKEWFRVIFKGW